VFPDPGQRLHARASKAIARKRVLRCSSARALEYLSYDFDDVAGAARLDANERKPIGATASRWRQPHL
jgi:hypothetical protein